MYPDRTALWVLPDELYGKYVEGTNPLFLHLHGSTWHGDDAKSILWFVHHRLLLGLLAGCLLCGLFFWAIAACRLRALRALSSAASPVKTVQLREVLTWKVS